MNEERKAPRAAIIMPAYNAADTIEKTIRSVLNQSMGDLLLIAVDDGSTDETAAVLERLHDEDARLLPIRVPNGGPARARNVALEAVPDGTEYIMFSDADDLLLPDALEYAIENGGGADLVLMGYSIIQPDGSENRYFEPQALYTPDTLGAALGRLYKANLLNQVWGKLFRAELIRGGNLRFADFRWGEDRLFLYGCLERAGSVAVLPEVRYQYIMHPGESLITQYYNKKPDVCVLADERMQELCERFGVEDQRDFRYMFMKGIFSCMTTLFSPKCTLTKEEKQAEILRILENEHVRARSIDVFGGPAMQSLCAVIRTGSVPLNYAAFSLVAKAGEAAPKLFTRIKHQK